MQSLVLVALLNFCLMGYPIYGQNTGLAQPSLLLPTCSTDCPLNKRCVQDNVTVVWELLSSSKECKSYLACYGPDSDYPDDTTTNIFAGRFYPIVVALGSNVYFEAIYTSPLFNPFKIYNVSQGDFLACRNARQVVATLTSRVKVPDRFLSTLGYKFFIATGRGKYLPCNLALRLHLNVKNATNCSVAMLPPGGKLCSGKGKCISESFTGEMYCECCSGYTGKFCEELDACYAKPCQRGNCSDIIAGHTDTFNCACEVGYTGYACDIDIDECRANNVVCQNGGYCDDGVNSYTCLCLSGFHGKHCELVSNMCELIKPCKNNGNCSRVGSFKHSYVCHCAPGFYGQNCTLNSTTTFLVPQLSSILKTSYYQTASDAKTVMYPTPSTVTPQRTRDLPSSGLISPSVAMVIPSSSVLPTQQPYENQTCADLPCGEHGVCTNRGSSASGLPFQCDCQYPTVGPICTTDLELHFPYFNGNSYIKYKSISFGSRVNEFIISFRTQVDGTILFSGHRTYRDFIKLEVIGGLLKFSVDAGDKMVSVTSRENVVNGNTTAAKFGYDTRTGSVFMSVNDGVERRSTTRGKLRDVQLYYPLYLGGIVPAVYTQSKPDVGTITPFVGCVREMEFNERTFDLSDAVNWQNISECDIPACRAKPCENGGVCIQNVEVGSEYSCRCSYPYSGKNCEEKYACEVNVCNGGKCLNTSSSGVECLCPFGRGGVSCNQDVDVTIPTFSVVKNHSSYVQYLTPRAAVSQLDIRMEIKLSNDSLARGSGLLFYVGLHDHLSVGSDGDYLALGVQNNRVVLQFNLGSGGTNITSNSELSYDEKWITILAGRKGRDGYLYVDNDIKEGSSPPPLVGLNVFGHLYLGGIPEFSMLNSEVVFTEGFRGAIKDPKVRTGISNSWLPLSMEHSTNDTRSVHVVQGLNIQDQRVNACVVGACVNNGTCQSLGASYVCRCLPMFSGMTCNDTSVPCRDHNPCHGRSTCRMRDSGFICDCPPGKAGRYCENDLNITTPYFGEYSFLSLVLGKIKIHARTSLTITFSTSAMNGILFYITRDLTSHSGDFMSITLHERYLYLIYNLGTGIAKCKSDMKILLNQNNNVTMTRDARTSHLELNGSQTSCTSRGGATQLNVASVLYLGGVPDLAQVQPMAYENTRDLRDFTGCVEQLIINGRSFDLTQRGVLAGRNIINCGATQIQA